MSAINDLLGSVITGARDVIIAGKNADAEALRRQYELDALRASVNAAEAQRQREATLLAQTQDYFRANNDKVINALLFAVVASLVGVIGYNILKGR